MPSDPPAVAVHVRVEGRVQGVWFRGWAVQEAAARGLRGWVRNRGDGGVEAVFAGAEAKVAEMVSLCRRGPPSARVLDVRIEPAAVPHKAGFHVRPTL